MRKTLAMPLAILLVAIAAPVAAQPCPDFIPHAAWQGLRHVGDPGRQETEFKAVIRGQGLESEFRDNASLRRETRQALEDALMDPKTHWEAPRLLGRPYEIGAPSDPVFLDVYYDTVEPNDPCRLIGLNFLVGAEYRFRLRFATPEDLIGFASPRQDRQPTRMEYQSRFDRTPFQDGLTTLTESRFELRCDRRQCPPRPMDKSQLILNAQTGTYSPQAGRLPTDVIEPSSQLVEFFRRIGFQDPKLHYVPDIVLETDRGRDHLLIELFAGDPEEAFIITVDTSRIYTASEYLNWFLGRTPQKPDPREVLNEVEVEFDRAIADLNLDAISAGLRAAFLADQRRVRDLIREHFAKISRGRGNPNFLVLEPGEKSKYKQAFEALYFKRGDVDYNGRLRVTDAIRILNYLFRGGTLVSEKSADVNGDGHIDVSDPIYLLLYLFRGGPEPPPPFKHWGPFP